MRNKRIYIVLCVIVVFMLVGCGKDKEGDAKTTTTSTYQLIPTETLTETVTVTKTEEPIVVTTTEPEIDPMEGKVISKLTGLPIDEETAKIRPVGMMINNIPAALPQSGIRQADIIFETLVEGGYTRLFAIFQDYDSEKIGPVRSARHYYMNFAFDFDAVYIHYGESYLCYDKYKEWNVEHMNGLSYLDEIMCFRSTDRKAPHNLYVKKSGVVDALKSKKYRSTIDDEFKYGISFNDSDTELEDGTKAIKLTIPISWYQTSIFKYDSETKQYMRYQFDEPHIDIETSEQLYAKNVIIQLTSIWNIPNDDAGRLDATLVGEGTGYYITDGKMINIKWKKEDVKTATVYTDLEGNPIKLNPGKTWITVAKKNTKIVFE